MNELHQWRADHENILLSLGLSCGASAGDSRSSKGKKGADHGATSKGGRSDRESSGVGNTSATPMDEGDDDPPDDGSKEGGSNDADGEGVRSEEREKKMTPQNLSACIHAAEKITIGKCLKEVREMRLVLLKVNEWIEQCQSLCPRRQSKRRVQPINKPTFDRLQDFIAEGLASPVGVVEEVDRIRRHIAEALSWQLNAKSVLETVCRDFAEQTNERKGIWQKEEEESRKDSPGREESGGKSPASKDGATSPKVSPEATGGVDDTAQTRALQAKETGNDANREGAMDVVEQGGDSTDGTSDGNDREDELDETEESNEAAIQQLLTTARDISVFMPEELVAERVQRIMEWAR